MFEDKACKCEYENGDAQFAAGMKATTVKENCRVEQPGPTGINQPRKTETSRPTRKEDKHPSKINIHVNLKDNLFYLSKKDQLMITVIMSGVVLSLLELTKSTKMWRRCSRISRSLM
jgi:hypothetical protein